MHATFGGAINLSSGILIIDSAANLIFSHNSADYNGGALSLENSTVHVNTSDIEFYDNKASHHGGAITVICGSMIINSNKSIKLL